MNINFGCGSVQPSDWINIDLDPEFRTEYKDLSLIPDNSCDTLVCHAIICCVKYHDIEKMLSEFYRVLRPTGVVRISLPDIVSGFDAYKNNNINFFPNSEDDLDKRFSAWLTWYSQSVSLLTNKALQYKLQAVKFSNVSETKFKQTVYSNEKIYELDTRENEFYFMEAIK
jgi:ubiquinone/menaquinone biosynthesis C-methylase UbiE